MYQLYYYPNNASLAPHFLLHYMKLDYELLLVDKQKNGQKSPEYLKLNPAGRIPVLVKDGEVLFESPAICIHLCESHPEFNLMPEIGDPKRPKFYQWLTYLNNTLQAELMGWYYADRHTNDPSTVPNVKAAQAERIKDALEVINEQLTENKFLLGEQISACDFFMFMLAEWCLPMSTPLEFKHLRRYLKGLSQHPTVQSVCEIEEMDISAFSAID